jgi:hypothetical protein
MSPLDGRLRSGFPVVIAFLVACTGTISDPGASADGPFGPDGNVVTPPPGAPPPDGCVGDACLAYDPVPSPLLRAPRLTHAQWASTVSDLLRLDSAASLALELEPTATDGDFDTGMRSLRVSALLWSQYQRAAETLAEEATASPTTMARWMPEGLPTTEPARTEAFIDAFGLRVFRRPLTDAQRGRLLATFAEGPGHFGTMEPFAAGVRLVLEGVLQSPYFLYRIELSTTVTDGLIALDGYETATRLSYALWNTTPDDDLLAAAASGHLDTEEGLRDQVQRLVGDPRFDAVLARFHEQHLQLDHLDEIPKDSSEFPEWSDAVARSARAEIEAFLDTLVDDGLGVHDLLLSRSAHVDGRLASLYGVSGVADGSVTTVELPADRGGILTRVGFLAANASLRDPDPIHRGVFINRRLLCRTLNPPDDITSDPNPPGNTNREKYDAITGEGTCGASCHATIINPPGYALEQYDAIGRFRTMDNGYPVDAAARYTFADGTEVVFDGGRELSERLAESPLTHECYAQKLVEFITGRAAQSGDDPLVFRAGQESLNDAASIEALAEQVVTSRVFRFRTPVELDGGAG